MKQKKQALHFFNSHLPFQLAEPPAQNHLCRRETVDQESGKL